MLNTKVNYPKITLAAARVNAGYSQKEAASRLKINERTLQNYESGANVPDWDMVHKSVNFTISRLIIFFLALNYA